MRVYRQLVLLGAMTMVPACSGSKEKEPEEPAAEESSASEAEAKAPAAAAAAEAAAPAAPAPAAAAPAAPAAPEPAAAAPASSEPAGFTGAKVTRYVTTYALKIHPQPDKTSPVLGWVKRGDAVDVVINGEWAKLDNGKYISAKFLSEQNPGPSPAAKKKKKAAQ